MPFFSRVFKGRSGGLGHSSNFSKNGIDSSVSGISGQKPALCDFNQLCYDSDPRSWDDAWTRAWIAPEDIQDMIHICSLELKSRALEIKFPLLPFRPEADTLATRGLVKNYFKFRFDESTEHDPEAYLQHELRLADTNVLCSLIKWCWSRMPGGVITWEVYGLFKVGESDANFAHSSFGTLIPLACRSEARRHIILDFFDLLAAVAARSRINGLGGRKLSRLAAWWAFDLKERGGNFEDTYQSWLAAADASSHLFFAYLRFLSPDEIGGVCGVSTLPRSLQALVAETEYPPQTPSSLVQCVPKVTLNVMYASRSVTETLERARYFEYRPEDTIMRTFCSFSNPLKLLTDESRRIVSCIDGIPSTLSYVTGGGVTGLNLEPVWAKFEDFGFDTVSSSNTLNSSINSRHQSMSITLSSTSNLSNWERKESSSPPLALDGLTSTTLSTSTSASTSNQSSGKSAVDYLQLSSDRMLPPIRESQFGGSTTTTSPFKPCGNGPGNSSAQNSSDVNNTNLNTTNPNCSNNGAINGTGNVREGNIGNRNEPGDYAKTSKFEFDETFSWVWMMSRSNEEPAVRKSLFEHCIIVETDMESAPWMIIEERIRPEPVAQGNPVPPVQVKKSRFPFSPRQLFTNRKTHNLHY